MEIEQFGITEEQLDAVVAKKVKIQNYTFGICSAVCILAGIIYGLSIAHGVYETVLFFLFFGCFLGSILGGISAILLRMLFFLVLYISSPVYRSSKRYLAARSRTRLNKEGR